MTTAPRDVTTPCPACGATDRYVFFDEADVPTNSCLLLDSAEESAGFPRGTIEAAMCRTCGFVGNQAFEPGRAEYSQRYEELSLIHI